MEFRKATDGRARVVKGFNVSAFFEVIAEVVTVRGATWKLVASEIGVSPSTLSRRSRGRCPDAATLAALSAWAGVNPADFVARPGNGATSPLAAISGVLRSDPNLGPEAVRALEAILRVAYASFERTKQEIELATTARSVAVSAPLTARRRGGPSEMSATEVKHGDDALFKLESTRRTIITNRQAA